MAVVATNCKRGVGCLTIPFRHSPNLQVLKKRRFSCPKNPVSSSSSTMSSRSSAKQVEFHAHRRGFLRFRSLGCSPVLKRKKKPRDSRRIGDMCDALPFHKEDDQVIVVDDDPCSTCTSGNNVGVVSLLNPLMEKPLEVSDDPFRPLNDEEKAQVKHAFSWEYRMEVLVSHKYSNLDIHGTTLRCLRPTKWLNDEVINLYLELLKERETRDPQKYFKCHFFNTFFYIKLVSGTRYNYKAVRRWTTQRKLGYELIDCDTIFVPIHGDEHWTLAVINMRERKFLYLDSLNEADPTEILNALAKYLVDEVKDKSGKDIDVSSWDIESVKDLPRQHNGYDCGMFMLKYIDFYSRGLSLDFSQKDMPYFRLRTANEILRLRAG